MRVLLVDDSSTMRRIQKTQLNGLGVSDVIEASNGKEAYDQLVKFKDINFILLDWNMPIMDGITFLKKARENEEFNNTKIIMCTSESEKGRVLEALKAGANNYIVKPFDVGALKEKLGLG